MKRQRFQKYRPDTKGFALVVVLSLLPLLLICVVSLSSFVTIELSSLNALRQQELARKNCLLALNVALSELQSYTGPDQRATATSAIAEGNPSYNLTPAPDDATSPGDDTVRQVHWTGVWAPEDVSGQTIPRHLTWLVSGNERVNPSLPEFQDGTAKNARLYSRPNSDNASLAAESAWMVHTGSATATRDFVQVPMVEIKNHNAGTEETTGRYAWWIGDEGTKADISLGRLAADTLTSQDSKSLVSPQRIAADEISGLDTLTADRSALSKLGNRFEATLASGSSVTESTVRDRFHDITTRTRGVLTDPLNGGLKRDLTAAFASDANFSSLLADFGEGLGNSRIFPAVDETGTSATANDDNPGGPQWAQLRSFHNNRPTGGAAAIVDLSTQTPDRAGIFPVISAFQLYWGASRIGAPSPTTVRFWLMPSVSFWNPYNFSIRVPATTFRVTSNRAFSGGAFRDDFNFVVTGFASATATTETGFYLPITSNSGNYPLRFPIETFTIGPGETLTFSPASTAPLTTPTPTLGEGWRDNTGFYLDGPLRTRADAAGVPATATHYFIGMMQSGLASGGYVSRVEHLNLEWSRTDPGSSQPTGAANPDDLIVYIANVFARHVDDNRIRTGADLIAEPNQLLLDSAQPLDVEKRGIDVRLTYTNDSDATFPYREPSHQQFALVPWLAHGNPRSHFQNISPVEISNESHFSPPGYAYGWRVDGARSDTGFGDEANLGSGYFDSGFFGKEKTVLFDLPRADEPILSVGQLTQANLGFSPIDTNSNPLTGSRALSTISPQTLFNRAARYLNTNINPAYAIGNSLADPRIPSSQVARNWASSGFTFDESPYPSVNSNATRGWHYDQSYLLNRALWDPFFFSGLPQSGGLPDVPDNSLLELDPEATTAMLRDPETAAAHMSVRGMFNVNSQSVEAWKAVLSAFFGSPVTKADGVTDANAATAPFLRTLRPQDTAYETTDLEDSDTAYAGYRNLTPAEIESLANSIVDTFKERRTAPYLSFSEFVNRNPAAADPRHQREGLLHQAIDPLPGEGQPSGASPVFNLNHPFRIETDFYRPEGGAYGDRGVQGAPNQMPNEAAMEGPLAFGVPGFLMPADLLARLGAILSTRSDTFIIRAFGETVDPATGSIESRAHCEVVVQRLAEFVDPSQNPETEATALNITNEKFGRRFVVSSFRWLSEDEI